MVVRGSMWQPEGVAILNLMNQCLNGTVLPGQRTFHAVTVPLIQEQALIYSIMLNHDDFTASNGWLDSFKTHYGIKEAVLSGEVADVNQDVVDAWAECLATICGDYDSKDIFNADDIQTSDDRPPVLTGRFLGAKGVACQDK